MTRHPPLDPHRRADLRRALRLRYEDDELTIRQLAAECGRTYGTVRALLVEAGTTLRARGRRRTTR